GIVAAAHWTCAAASAQIELSWYTIDSGGGICGNGGIMLYGTIGEPGAGRLANGNIECLGGFLGAGGVASCYANCDSSTTPPTLNVLDFACFLNRFASSDTYANCDSSTTPPVLNVLDFACFLNRFAAGCS